MRDHHDDFRQVLAVDPMARGFAFALLERGDRLVDWGRKRGLGGSTQGKCVAAVQALIRLYRPDALVLEDCTAPASRRCRRVRTLIRALSRIAARQGIQVRHVPPRFLREVCAGNPRATKHDVAGALATRFPELARKVPPRRKAWMTEDSRINLFDALALAASALQAGDRAHRSRDRP